MNPINLAMGLHMSETHFALHEFTALARQHLKHFQ